MFDDFKARLSTLLDVPQVLGTIHERISGLTEVLYKWHDKPPPPEPAPFVCVVAFAEMLDRSGSFIPNHDPPRFGFRSAQEEEPVRVVQTTLGDSGYIDGPSRNFHLEPHVSLRKIHILVFCDLSRVHVVDIKAGNEKLSASAFSTCPAAYYDRVLEPGSRMTIQCARRALF